jgi:hypothetical protein
MSPGAVNILNLPFVQVALPILIGFITMGWWQNKRIDDRPRSIDHRLGRIEAKLDNHAERITRLEERTSLVRS